MHRMIVRIAMLWICAVHAAVINECVTGWSLICRRFTSDADLFICHETFTCPDDCQCLKQSPVPLPYLCVSVPSTIVNFWMITGYVHRTFWCVLCNSYLRMCDFLLWKCRGVSWTKHELIAHHYTYSVLSYMLVLTGSLFSLVSLSWSPKMGSLL